MHQDLTLRENEIFDLLLAGKSPKEIAHDLSISNDTIMVHRKNIYRKLDVHSINELLSKFLPANENTKTEKTPAQDLKTVFSRWTIIKDDIGSYVELTPKIEYIQDQYTETYTLSGNVINKTHTFAGVIAFPDPFTLEVMSIMKSFSFTVLGDGNTYQTKIITPEAKTDHNYYGKAFRTENGVISTLSFNIEELSQLLNFDKKVPFINTGIEAFLIQIDSTGDFNLKFWNIKFIRK